MLLLTLCWVPCQCALPAVVVAAVGVAIPVTYSFFVDVYASIVLRRMQEVPTSALNSTDGFQAAMDLESARGGAMATASTCATKPLASTTDLRKMISEASGLVERASDRRKWNQWSLSKMSRLVANPSSSTTREQSEKLLSNLRNNTYSFAYRSYVNSEEKGSISKAFKSPLYWLFARFRLRSKTKLYFGDSTSDVEMTDHYFARGFQPMRITWYGKVVSPKRGWFRSNYFPAPARIEWSRTELCLGNDDDPNRKIIPNPPAAEKMRALPWDIVTEEDGMVLLRRGDIGVLAFDLI